MTVGDDAAPARFVDHVVDLLAPTGIAGGVTARRMFGGHGIFHDGLMFALIAGDRLYFKADDANRAEYEAAGSEPFTYMRRGKPASLSYYSVPDEALEDPHALRDWAERGIAAARRAAAMKRTKPKRKKAAGE